MRTLALLPVLSLLLPALAACGGAEDTADTDADTDTDTDTDADTDADADADADADTDCLQPVGFNPAAWLGVSDGAPTTAWLDGEEVLPRVDLGLYDERFWIDLDPAWSCTMAYTAAGGAGTSDPDAWFGWTLSLTPDEGRSTCDRLCPTWPTATLDTLAAQAWDVSVAPIDPTFVDLLTKVWGWTPDLEAVSVGGDIHLEGSSLSDASEYAPAFVTVAFQVDDEMQVVDSSLFVDAADLEAGPDGLYVVQTPLIWFF